MSAKSEAACRGMLAAYAARRFFVAASMIDAVVRSLGELAPSSR
jgi:hypothetical protein